MSGARLRGDRVTQMRRAAGQRQVDLASRLGTREQRVGEWERGTQQPHPRQLVALARELQVQPLQLLDVDAEDPPLQALRLAAGLTLHEMAQASGLAFSTYRRLEVGAVRRSPSPEALQRISAALQVAPERVAAALGRNPSGTGPGA